MAYEFPYDAVLRINGLISRGVKAAEIDENGHLLLTLTDNTVADLGSAVGPQGKQGFTFTPTVSDDGDLSWTNNGGLENPETKNIRGPQGKQGAQGVQGANGAVFTPTVSDDGDLSWTNDGGLENPEPRNIRGPQGKQGGKGETGTPGAPGFSPTVSISKTGKVTTITITDENGEHTATISDGADGNGAGDMLASIYDPAGKQKPVLFKGDIAVAVEGTKLVVTAPAATASGETYNGTYQVTPQISREVTLPTENKVCTDDITVRKVPQAEVSNEQGGTTLIIGNEQ